MLCKLLVWEIAQTYNLKWRMGDVGMATPIGTPCTSTLEPTVENLEQMYLAKKKRLPMEAP